MYSMQTACSCSDVSGCQWAGQQTYESVSIPVIDRAAVHATAPAIDRMETDRTVAGQPLTPINHCTQASTGKDCVGASHGLRVFVCCGLTYQSSVVRIPGVHTKAQSHAIMRCLQPYKLTCCHRHHPWQTVQRRLPGGTLQQQRLGVYRHMW